MILFDRICALAERARSKRKGFISPEMAVKIVKKYREPEHKHVIVVSTRAQGYEIADMLHNEFIDATCVFADTNSEARRIALENGNVVILPSGLALVGWAFKNNQKIYHFIPQCILSHSEEEQLLGRARRCIRLLWSERELTEMTSLQENVGVWYEDTPRIGVYSPLTFDKFLKTWSIQYANANT